MGCPHHAKQCSNLTCELRGKGLVEGAATAGKGLGPRGPRESSLDLSFQIHVPNAVTSREIAEREANKRMEGARSTWAALLKAIFLRMGLQDAGGAKKGAKKAGKRAAGATDAGNTPARWASL